jgi:hypothetical protein
MYAEPGVVQEFGRRNPYVDAPVADDNDNDDDNSKLSTRMKSGPSLWT